MRNTYTVVTTFGSTFQFTADLTEAAAPIRLVDEDDGELVTPLQTADARHRATDAAVMLMQWFGPEYWLDPSHDRPADEWHYIESLIDFIEEENDVQ